MTYWLKNEQRVKTMYFNNVKVDSDFELIGDIYLLEQQELLTILSKENLKFNFNRYMMLEEKHFQKVDKQEFEKSIKKI